jgi:transcriptional regulator with PAS, ATPase and Fis domain
VSNDAARRTVRPPPAVGELDDGTTELDTALTAPNAVRRFRLTLVEGQPRGLEWESSGDRCSVGSHASNDLVLDDSTVSRFHCEIVVDRRGARVRDLGSLNGTVVDGTRVVEAFLRDGSVVRVGRTGLRFELEAQQNAFAVSEQRSFGGLVGESIAMRAAFAVLERVAASDSTVLIEGETGTGKEVAAESIHHRSARAEGPLVVVDCGAVPPNLLESSLFGHEKGAFTGADQRRIGAFEEASGGSIFLDEIGELPLELQPKLLRVIERRQIQRVGSSAQKTVDVRIVAATNRDLRAMVNAGTFRADLYYRLAVVRVRLPALRERPEDIPGLVEHFLDALRAPAEPRARLTAPDFVGSLCRAAWPGNVRELRNALERCLVLDRIAFEPEHSSGSVEPALDLDLPYEDARRRALADFERRYLRALLAAHRDNVSQAARAAGLGRVYLHRLLKRHALR